MASHSGEFPSLCSNEEMAAAPKELCEFMKTAKLPLCVCVVSGKHLTSSVQLTKGDLLYLKSCETKMITLTHQESGSGSRKQVNVPLDFPYKFTVLPPKNVSDRTASIIMYPSISDLLMDSPTYFEATTPYDDPYLPGFSVHRGDRFKFRGLVTDPKDGRERLKVLDELENVLLLSLDCCANFCPLEDYDSYTLRQLIDFAPVPRRLKISKNDSAVPFSNSGDSGFRDCYLANEDEKDNSCLYDTDIFQMINSSSIIHMLKPNLLVNASPVNDTDTLWKIPLTADLCVREYDLDDYEVPAVARNKEPALISSLSLQTPMTPTFPAPPTPPLPQPVVPVDVFNFANIYGCPVKAKVLDSSNCDVSLQNMLNGIEDLSIHRLDKIKRLYAEDLKNNKVYNLSPGLKISFIEYPETFSEVSELLALPVGSEITVLEDIASDYPRPFFLQFGDLLRIVTNSASSVRPKNTNIDCQVLKCEKVNREGGSNVKMKLPLDFEVKMVLSIDPNNRRVLGLDDIISGMEPIPDQEVATLIDGSEKILQNLPVNLKLLKVFPERMLVASPFVKKQLESSSSQSEIKDGDWPSPTKLSLTHKNIGISLTSGLVLAFRGRLDVYDMNVIKSHAETIQVPFEVLTHGQYEERERMCKLWTDEDESDVQSVASDERSSTIESSSQRIKSTRQSGKRQKSKKMDKIRRLSQVLNPKHWRPPKAAPEPLPHPEAMGLMALSMRPPSEQTNDYDTKEGDEQENLKGVVPHSSVSSDEVKFNETQWVDHLLVKKPVDPKKSQLSSRAGPTLRCSKKGMDKKERKKFNERMYQMQSIHELIASLKEMNIYEDMEVGVLRTMSSTPPPERTETKGFSNRLHKSMPLKQIISRTYAKNRARNREKNQSKQTASSPIHEHSNTNFSVEDCEIENEGGEDVLYDAPQEVPNKNDDKQEKHDNSKQGYVIPQNNLLKKKATSSECSQHNSSSLPPLPPRRSASSLENSSSHILKHTSMESLLDKSSTPISDPCDKDKEFQSKGKISIEPPVPPRRKIIVKSFHNDDDAKNANSNNITHSHSSAKTECKSERNLCVNKEQNIPVLQSVANSEPENEETYPYSKVDKEKKVDTTQHQKIPIPKPRGLKKLKSPELQVKVDAGVKSTCSGEASTGNSLITDGSVDCAKIEYKTSGAVQTAKDTQMQATVASGEETVIKKDCVKPKLPPKPKPRIT